MSEAVLFVDDDPNILASFKRQLRKEFKISTAVGGAQALEIIEQNGPFAVVISDMRMPGMNGLEFLGKVKEVSPDTILIMLTGNADQETATDAINEGRIFRFHAKPCPPEDMGRTIGAALEQFRFASVEKELLEQTLAGSVKVLVDVLALIDPDSFGKVQLRRDWITRMARSFKGQIPWRLSMAAMLSDLGTIAVPGSLVVKARSGGILTEEEQQMIESAPGVAKNLIANIPRMKPVSEIVYYQDKGYDGTGFPDDDLKGDELPLGARVLKVVNDLIESAVGGEPDAAAFDRLDFQSHLYDPAILAMARKLFTDAGGREADIVEFVEVGIGTLLPGHFLASDIATKAGKLLLASGQEITEAQLNILHNYIKVGELQSTVLVRRSSIKKRMVEERAVERQAS